MEELVLDTKTGRAVNASLMDYKIPSTEDVPAVMDVAFVETAQKDGPMGARGIGEHTMIPTPAAIANAVYDACGIRISEMPITAEKVWRALKAKEEAERTAAAVKSPEGVTA
jgi:CO/xanthine dehydrogenase Mo-binding subunit